MRTRHPCWAGTRPTTVVESDVPDARVATNDGTDDLRRRPPDEHPAVCQQPGNLGLDRWRHDRPRCSLSLWRTAACALRLRFRRPGCLSLARLALAPHLRPTSVAPRGSYSGEKRTPGSVADLDPHNVDVDGIGGRGLRGVTAVTGVVVEVDVVVHEVTSSAIMAANCSKVMTT